MKLKVIAIDIVNLSEKIIYISCYENSTLSDIQNEVCTKYGFISFQRYYNNQIYFYYYITNDKIPYILSKESNKLFWDIDLTNSLISDFIYTHGIDIETGMTVEYGFPQCGGIGLDSAIKMWSVIYPILEVVATFGGVIGFVQWIFSIFKKNIPYPDAIMHYIYNQNSWNIYILSDLLKMTKEDTIILLKLLGYKWNNSKKLYLITEGMKKDKIKKLKEINIVDCVK